MLYCHFIIIYRKQESSIKFLRSNENIKQLQIIKKNVVLKKFLKDDALAYSFYSIYLFSSMSTGFCNLKKKSNLNVLFEVKYKLELENHNKKYYIGKFNLKNASLTIIDAKCFIRQSFYESKIISSTIMNLIITIKSWSSHRQIEYPVYKRNNHFKYIFKFIKSRSSTSFFDEISVLNIKIVKKIYYFSKILTINLLEKNLTKFDSNSLNLSKLYIFSIKNSKKTALFELFFKFAFSVCLYKSLKCFILFIGGDFVKNFTLSSEIIFYNSNGSFNPSSFLFDKYSQMIREKYKVYSNKIFKFFLIWINKFLFDQIKKNCTYYKKIDYPYTYIENPTVIFQKKFIERIGEKLWNLKLKFSEFHLDVYLKKFKKFDRRNTEFFYSFSKWMVSIISTYTRSVDFFDQNGFGSKILLPKYIVFNCLIFPRLYFTLKGWYNSEIDSNIFISFHLINKNVGFDIFNKFFFKLILKKYFKYDFD